MHRRSQWPRYLMRRSAADRLLRLWVRIPPGACCKCCMLSGRGLCDELITRPEEYYRLWYVVVCDLQTPWMRRPWPTRGCRAKNKNKLMHQAGLNSNSFILNNSKEYFICNPLWYFPAELIICRHLEYTGCNRRNGPDFGRVFLRSYYTDIIQNTYIQSSMVTNILTREVWNFDSYYSLIEYQIHIETGRNMWFL